MSSVPGAFAENLRRYAPATRRLREAAQRYVDAAGGPGLGAALKGAALAVALAAFSQVPLGKQDVSIPANDPSRVPVTNFVKVLD